MFTKTLLGLSAAMLIALPVSADAHGRNRQGYGGYSQNAYGSDYNRQDAYGGYQNYPQDSYGGYQNYPQGYYNDGYQNYPQGYYGQTDGRRGYNNYGSGRCKGTAGTIVGGVAGAVIGSSVGGSRGYDNYGNYRRGGSTTGAIIGGALGALAGRQVDKSSCRSRY